MIPDRGSDREKAFYKQNRSALLFLRCREEWHGAAIRRTETRQLLGRRLRRNVSGAQANRLVISVHAAACVVRRPARLVLEQANRANAAVSANIEPMQGSSRNANQVAGLDLDHHDQTLSRMNMDP